MCCFVCVRVLLIVVSLAMWSSILGCTIETPDAALISAEVYSDVTTEQQDTCDVAVVDGDVVVDDDSGMAALAGVKAIRGTLSVVDARLTELRGLECLEEVGSLEISGNSELATLSGLEALTTVRDDLTIEGNPRLNSLDGLDSLREVGGGLSVVDNQSLLDFDGLATLERIGGDLTVWNNPALEHIEALSSIERIPGNLVLWNNDAILSLAGLESLAQVELNVLIGFNDALEDLRLESLSNVGHLVSIVYNPRLSSCDAQRVVEALMSSDEDGVFEHDVVGNAADECG